MRVASILIFLSSMMCVTEGYGRQHDDELRPESRKERLATFSQEIVSRLESVSGQQLDQQELQKVRQIVESNPDAFLGKTAVTRVGPLNMRPKRVFFCAQASSTDHVGAMDVAYCWTSWGLLPVAFKLFITGSGARFTFSGKLAILLVETDSNEFQFRYKFPRGHNYGFVMDWYGFPFILGGAGVTILKVSNEKSKNILYMGGIGLGTMGGLTFDFNSETPSKFEHGIELYASGFEDWPN